MPPSLKSKPELFEDVNYCVSGFMYLSSSRLNWHSHIPLTEILAYCNISGIVNDELEFFCKAIRQMDSAYLNKAVEKHGRDSRASTNS